MTDSEMLQLMRDMFEYIQVVDSRNNNLEKTRLKQNIEKRLESFTKFYGYGRYALTDSNLTSIEG